MSDLILNLGGRNVKRNNCFWLSFIRLNRDRFQREYLKSTSSRTTTRPSSGTMPFPMA